MGRRQGQLDAALTEDGWRQAEDVQGAAGPLAPFEAFANLAPASGYANQPPPVRQVPYGISTFITGDGEELGMVRFWRVTRR